MEGPSNNSNDDQSQRSFKEKIKFFEKFNSKFKGLHGKNDPGSSVTLKARKILLSNYLLTKPNSSSDNNPRNSSSVSLEKKTSTSTTENNPGSFFPSSTSSNSILKTTSTTNSDGTFEGMHPLKSSTTKKASKAFQKASQEILNDGKIPEILEIFTDLDLFIEKELDEIVGHKDVSESSNDDIDFDELLRVFANLKNEFVQEKQKYQKELETQIEQQYQKDEMRFETIDEGYEEVSLDYAIESQMNRLRSKKIEKLEKEAVKQEYLLSKINRVLEHVKNVNEHNLASIINIERHFLVASSRFQSALKEIERLNDPREKLHPRPFHRRGKCVVKEIMLEVKGSYFERGRPSHNEFFVVMLMYNDEVYASKAISVTDDVRTIRFPHKFCVSDAYIDFEMRLEVFGTTFWRQRNTIRPTMMKKYGFFSFTLADTGDKRKRFDMVEVIKSDQNPLRKKILMKVHQTITPEVHFENVLFVKLGDSWLQAQASLHGHLLEIRLPDNDCIPMFLDLHNLESDFDIPFVSHVSSEPFTFLLRFNHYVSINNFCLLVAAESAEDYSTWVKSINKVLALINN